MNKRMKAYLDYKMNRSYRANEQQTTEQNEEQIEIVDRATERAQKLQREKILIEIRKDIKRKWREVIQQENVHSNGFKRGFMRGNLVHQHLSLSLNKREITKSVLNLESNYEISPTSFYYT